MEAALEAAGESVTGEPRTRMEKTRVSPLSEKV